MSSYDKDAWGHPSDPEIRQHWQKLGYLVGEFWSCHDANRRNEIVQEYHHSMARMYELGWDDILDMESILPDEIMPAEYIHRVGMSEFNPEQWKMPKQQPLWREYWEWLINGLIHRFQNRKR